MWLTALSTLLMRLSLPRLPTSCLSGLVTVDNGSGEEVILGERVEAISPNFVFSVKDGVGGFEYQASFTCYTKKETINVL